MTSPDVTPVADRSMSDPVATAVDQVARELGVDPAVGLSAEDVQARLASHGANRLAAGKKEPPWRAFLRQYEDFMQVILLAAAAVNQIVTGETGTTVVLAGLTVFNAVIGLRQESKAEESVKALAQMMKTIARVRRAGQAIELGHDEGVAVAQVVERGLELAAVDDARYLLTEHLVAAEPLQLRQLGVEPGLLIGG